MVKPAVFAQNQYILPIKSIHGKIQYMRSYHPYPPVVPACMRYVVVGTFPPARLTEHRLASGDVPFYYGSRENYLWPVIRELTGLTLNSSDEMCAYLHQAGIGMTDTIASCIRTDGSSSDAALRDIAWRDNSALLENCAHVLFTSVRAMKDTVRRHPLNVAWTVLPSPSGSSNRSIGAGEAYRRMKSADPAFNTFRWRLLAYEQWFVLGC